MNIYVNFLSAILTLLQLHVIMKQWIFFLLQINQFFLSSKLEFLLIVLEDDWYENMKVELDDNLSRYKTLMSLVHCLLLHSSILWRLYIYI